MINPDVNLHSWNTWNTGGRPSLKKVDGFYLETKNLAGFN
ncbi:MAG: hypothetical protein JWQ63_713 [Mucilaginibacter sp.]|nr:hypothetical protein [Mucilaginibacter sp.]